MGPAQCTWILLAWVMVLAVLSAEGHKKKKIVVYVPQKVKHIHHHHVKKVYLKPKPQHHVDEYIEDSEDYLHRAGNDGEVVGDPAELWEQQDGVGEKVLEGSESTQREVVVYGKWGQKQQRTPLASSSTSSRRPSPPAVASRTYLSHVDRDGEQSKETDSFDGWTGLRSQRPQEGLHHHEQQSQQVDASTAQRHHHEQHHPDHHHHDQHHPDHHHHDQHHPDHLHHDQHHPDHLHHEQHHPDHLHHEQHHHDHHRHHKQIKKRPSPVSQQRQDDAHRQHEEHEVPEDIRDWVVKGFEKYHAKASTKASRRTPSKTSRRTPSKTTTNKEEEIDDIRVQVFEDGKELEVIKPKPRQEVSTEQNKAATEDVQHDHPPHQHQNHHYHQEDDQHPKLHHREGHFGTDGDRKADRQHYGGVKQHHLDRRHHQHHHEETQRPPTDSSSKATPSRQSWRQR